MRLLYTLVFSLVVIFNSIELSSQGNIPCTWCGQRSLQRSASRQEASSSQPRRSLGRSELELSSQGNTTCPGCGQSSTQRSPLREEASSSQPRRPLGQSELELKSQGSTQCSGCDQRSTQRSPSREEASSSQPRSPSVESELDAAGIHDLLPNQFLLKMQNNFTFNGFLAPKCAIHIPSWMRPDGEEPDNHYLFLRIANCHFVAFLRWREPLRNFNPAVQGPRSLMVNIRDGQFYTANSFRVYDVQKHNHRSGNERLNLPGDFPPIDHVYVKFRLGPVYSSPIRHHSIV